MDDVEQLSAAVGERAVVLDHRVDAVAGGRVWAGQALSYAGFFINLFNLFNLIPLSPFDGGRITAVLSPRIWFFGVPILAAMFLWRPSPMLVIVAILALPQLGRAFKYDPTLPENAVHYAGGQCAVRRD